MPDARLTRATPSDHAAILALNQAHETHTSPLDATALTALIHSAFTALVVDHGQTAMLIALDQHATYRSPNFLWFRERLARFVYIDRIIVAATGRGQGWGSRLYAALFTNMTQAAHTQAVCEVDIDPPNPASDAFHAALGFTEIGRAILPDRRKTVRYLARDLTRTHDR